MIMSKYYVHIVLSIKNHLVGLNNQIIFDRWENINIMFEHHSILSYYDHTLPYNDSLLSMIVCEQLLEYIV